METLRVSATDIDAFRRFRDNEDGDLSELLAQLRWKLPATDPMLAGSALHKALEELGEGEFVSLSADGYTFNFSSDAELDIPAIRECKATRDWVVDGCLVTLVGKVDAVQGKRIDDHKLTGHFDSERFLNSYQWRIYLEVFGADEFRWNIFEGRETEPRQYVISAVHPLTIHRYPGMEADVLHELRAFLWFAREFLPERIKAEAA